MRYHFPQKHQQALITESSLSKAALQKPAGKGPNDGTPRGEIFAKKIKNGEKHILNNGETVVITKVTMNGEVYGKKDMDKFVKDFEDGSHSKQKGKTNE